MKTVTKKSSPGAGADSIYGAPLRVMTSGIVILITLLAFESIAVSAALPTVAEHLDGIGSYGWAFTGLLIANVLGMVAAGQICDDIGPRRPMVAGFICFLVGLILSGTATTMLQLVAGRVAQGLGSGLLIIAIYVVVGEHYPAALQPKVFAATASAWVVPSLVGPVIAGAVTEQLSWRWVFLGLIPFAFLGAALLWPALQRLHSPVQRERAADWSRMARAISLAAGIAALSEMGEHPSLSTLLLALLGVVALIWGLRGLLPAGTLRVAPGVAGPVAMRGLIAGSLFAIEAMLPLGLTIQHGYGATAAGAPLACAGLAWAFGSWWQGRGSHAADVHRRVRLIRFGFGCLCVAGLVVAVAMLPQVPGWLAFPAWGLAGVGAGMAIASLSVLLLRFTNDSERGADTASLQLADVTCCAISTGIGGMLVAAAERGKIGFTTTFISIDVAMALVALIGVFTTGRIRPPVPN